MAAESIARAAGATVPPNEHRPTIQAHVAAGTGATRFRTPLGPSDPRPALIAETALWRPPTKVAMPYLATYLERLDAD